MVECWIPSGRVLALSVGDIRFTLYIRDLENELSIMSYIVVIFIDFSIEVYTGKQKMAGTDSTIYITLFGQHGSSKKIMLKDPSSDKRLFEKSSVDNFRLRLSGIGELKKIRIEHDGKGFASGWFLDKVLPHFVITILANMLELLFLPLLLLLSALSIF